MNTDDKLQITNEESIISMIKTSDSSSFPNLFLKTVTVNKAKDENGNIIETGEVEACWEAMDIYKAFYPSFKNCEAVVLKGRKLLVTNNDRMTADILTSISSLLTELEKDNAITITREDSKGKIRGENIIASINDYEKQSFITTNDEILLQYIKAFAKVYYTIGNMMPVPCNFKGGRVGDNWRRKLVFLLVDKPKPKITQTAWSKWKSCINSNEKNRMDFINNYFLNDMVEQSDNMILGIKKFTDKSEDNDFNFPLRSALSNKNSDDSTLNELRKIWLHNNTKLIVQRSFRILFDNNAGRALGFYNSDHVLLKDGEDQIKNVMKYLFNSVKNTNGNNTEKDITLF